MLTCILMQCKQVVCKMLFAQWAFNKYLPCYLYHVYRHTQQIIPATLEHTICDLKELLLAAIVSPHLTHKDVPSWRSWTSCATWVSCLMLPIVTRAQAKCKTREKSVWKDKKREMVFVQYLQNYLHSFFWGLSCWRLYCPPGVAFRQKIQPGDWVYFKLFKQK